MSDEFIKVATKEINEEIASINKILKSCKNDSDVFQNSQLIEKHNHKIKGLAPMMGKKAIGEIAGLIDTLLSHMNQGKKLPSIYSTLCETNEFMFNNMKAVDLDFEEIKQKITTKYSKYLD